MISENVGGIFHPPFSSTTRPCSPPGGTSLTHKVSLAMLTKGPRS